MNDVPYDRIPLRPVPDLEGLRVADAGGRPIGRLVGSLAEADTGLIRYLDLSLNGEPRHVLIPIGHTRIRKADHKPEVRLRAVVLDDLQRVPTYDPASPAIDDGYERALITAYGRSFYGDRYYAHPAFDHSGLFAGEHPIVPAREPIAAQARPPSEPTLALFSKQSDYRIASGEPDIIGWPLMTDADLPSGTVIDLVVDLDAELVRYVVVDVTDHRGPVLLPIGFLQLDARSASVYAPGLRHDDLATLPRFTMGQIERDVEEVVHDTLHGRLLDRRRYALPEFRDGRITNRRATEATPWS